MVLKTLVARISGVISVADDMCVNSCHAFTGPFADGGLLLLLET